MTRTGAVAVLAIALGALGAGQSGPLTLRVDPLESRMVIEVGKAGLFSFMAGHVHEVEAPGVSGVVRLDLDDLTRSDADLEVAAASLRVTGKGEPAHDVPDVQQHMLGPGVLDVAQYPTISFHTSSVALVRQARHAGGLDADLVLTGPLTIHGRSRAVDISVHLQLNGSALDATGRFRLKQTDYGIKPISVAGVVAVKDELAVTFSITARP